jgi:hypothetical protein
VAGERTGEVGHGGRGRGVAIEWDADMADFLMDRDDDLIDFPFDNPMQEAPANAQNVPPVAAPNAPVGECWATTSSTASAEQRAIGWSQ